MSQPLVEGTLLLGQLPQSQVRGELTAAGRQIVMKAALWGASRFSGQARRCEERYGLGR